MFINLLSSYKDIFHHFFFSYSFRHLDPWLVLCLGGKGLGKGLENPYLTPYPNPLARG